MYTGRLRTKTFFATRACCFRREGRGLPFRAARQCSGLSGPIGADKTQHQFKVLNRDLAYSGWRKIVKKTVRVEDEKDYVFDVVHQVLCITVEIL